MYIQKCNFKGLSATSLKYYAIFAMLIDHIAWSFVPTNSVLGQIMHIIGRATAPIMSFFIVEGFHYTKNIKKYLLRMGIFALISWPAYLFMEGIIYYNDGIKIQTHNAFYQGVLYTFFISLLILTVKYSKMHWRTQNVLYGMLFLLSFFGDWIAIIPAWVLVFDHYRGNFKNQAIGFSIISIILITILFSFGTGIIEHWYQYSVLLALIPLSLYNGKRGFNSENSLVIMFNKWIFYVFYPLHMLIIGLFFYI